jgi:hypothetical protein
MIDKWVLATRARPCAARTHLFELIITPNGALRATPRPMQLRCFSFDPKKYIKSIELGTPKSKAFFFPSDHMQTEEARPSQLCCSFQQYFGVKIMYRCDHTPEFFRFFFFFVCGSFLFVILCFFLSPLYFILIHFFLFFSSYLFLLFL